MGAGWDPVCLSPWHCPNKLPCLLSCHGIIQMSETGAWLAVPVYPEQGECGIQLALVKGPFFQKQTPRSFFLFLSSFMGGIQKYSGTIPISILGGHFQQCSRRAEVPGIEPRACVQPMELSRLGTQS